MPVPGSLNTAKAAVDHFRRNLGEALSCVSKEEIRASRGPYVPETNYLLTFEKPIRLTSSSGSPADVWLDVRHTFWVVPPTNGADWTTTTRKYEYRILTGHGRELLVYHWHPRDVIEEVGPVSKIVPYPHLHISGPVTMRSAQGTERTLRLDKLHVPTGRTSLESVIRMLLSEEAWAIKPKKRNWDQILMRTERRFLAIHTQRI